MSETNVDEVLKRLIECTKYETGPTASLTEETIEAIMFLEGFAHDLQKIIGVYETAIYRNVCNVVPTEETVRNMLEEIDCGRAEVARDRRDLDSCKHSTY